MGKTNAIDQVKWRALSFLHILQYKILSNLEQDPYCCKYLVQDNQVTFIWLQVYT